MKPVLFSGTQPTGKLHIGNYLGALRNFVELQNSGKYECIYCVVDLHSLTEDFDPKEKCGQILEVAADYLATGLDPKKSVIFQQSQVPAHTELTWILNTITPMGELRRMTQFKDKTQTNVSNLFEEAQRKTKTLIPTLETTEGIMAKEETMRMETANVGLFDYPVLMASDIVLYDTKFVPVGEDQLQHLELTRTLVRKFNNRFGPTFIEPQPILTKTARVMSLQNPTKKMSKSDPVGCLFLDDSPAEIENKIKRAVTDSGSVVKHDRTEKPGISNLLEIYSALVNEPVPKLEKKFAGKNYGAFKSALIKVITDHFADYRKKKAVLAAKPKLLASVLSTGSKKAAQMANKKMTEVCQRIGISV
ncbi:MAG: tryptophan--tRNA ligase [Candidatus Liptonbacteria bacterium]|nr:tryptophan--tRNA ligase [Candidatus Liptonbacteria bacterium]